MCRLGSFAAHEEYLRQLGADIKKKGFNVRIADTAGAARPDSVNRYTNTRDI